MDISQNKNGDFLFVRLAGRLDANWCGHVENALTTAIRAGEHRIHLDMSEVNYVSSAGLRVLLSPYKQLRAIKGTFGIVNPSETVRTVIELAGLSMILAQAVETAPVQADQGREIKSELASYEVFSSSAPASDVRLSVIGQDSSLQTNATEAQKFTFDADSWALGVGALGDKLDDCSSRFGEFLAVGGAAAFQPSDGSSRPDFVLSEGSLIPEGFLYLGLTGTGSFPHLARFEATGEKDRVGLAEVAETALEISQSSAVVIVAITETAGLVGATLQKSPTSDSSEQRFAFPKIRDWLSFTSERAYRDTTSLLVGVVSRGGDHPLLRPLGRGLMGHIHAACFPYRPLQKGSIELKPSVAALFEGQNLQAVLHLLADSREFNGAGESEFLRGALWIAPVTL